MVQHSGATRLGRNSAARAHGAWTVNPNVHVMAFAFRNVLGGLAITAIIAARTSSICAAGEASIAGDYVCQSGCRLTDAPPSIAIDGDKARCMNEFGGVYAGRLLGPTSVACFRKRGTLSADGKTILWSDGAVWKRL